MNITFTRQNPSMENRDGSYLNIAACECYSGWLLEYRRGVNRPKFLEIIWALDMPSFGDKVVNNFLGEDSKFIFNASCGGNVLAVKNMWALLYADDDTWGDDISRHILLSYTYVSVNAYGAQ